MQPWLKIASFAIALCSTGSVEASTKLSSSSIAPIANRMTQVRFLITRVDRADLDFGLDTVELRKHVQALLYTKGFSVAMGRDTAKALPTISLQLSITRPLDLAQDETSFAMARVEYWKNGEAFAESFAPNWSSSAVAQRTAGIRDATRSLPNLAIRQIEEFIVMYATVTPKAQK